MHYQKLLEQCKRNDGKAQRALYDHFKQKLMGLCRRYSRCREDAQDVLQDAFIKIFARITQVESHEKLEGWMMAVAVRTAIDHYHKKKREEKCYSEVEFDAVGIDYELVLENLGDEQLISLINALPDGCRIVFNLFEVEGYSHSEMAQLLAITEGTSRSQLHHAKQLLKQKLKALGVKRYEKLA